MFRSKVRFPISGGMGPSSELLSRILNIRRINIYSFSRRDKFPKEEGIGPVS